MNPTDNFNQILHDWLVDTAPQTMPATTHSDVIDRARRSRQRTSWSAALHGWVAGQGIRAVRVGRVARIGALVAATALIAIMLASGLGDRPPTPVESPTPVPSATSTPIASPTVGPLVAANFMKPFSYAIPSGASPLWISSDIDLYGFIDTEATGPPTQDSLYGVVQRFADRGLLVAWLDTPWVHPCPILDGDRTAVRTTPTEFFDDLDTIGGVRFEPVTETTLDGRAAFTTDLDVASNACPADLHIDPLTQGFVPSDEHLLLTKPSRLIVLDVDGESILVDIWAQSDAELEAWLPIATEFVNSIHFTSEP